MMWWQTIIIRLVYGSSPEIRMSYVEEGTLILPIDLIGYSGEMPLEQADAVLNTEMNNNIWPSWTNGDVSGFQLERNIFIVSGDGDVIRQDNQRHCVIGGSFSSPFSDAMNRYMFTPQGLILNPGNLTEFVDPDSMVYVTSTSVEQPRVEVSVAFENDSTETSPCIIGEFAINPASSHDKIPTETMDTLLASLRALNIPMEVGFIGDLVANVHIPNCSPEVLHRLPTLLFTIRSNARDVAVIRLIGSDYIRYTNINQVSCDLTLAGSARNFSIGSNTINKIVLYIDNWQRVIGFADPIYTYMRVSVYCMVFGLISECL